MPAAACLNVFILLLYALFPYLRQKNEGDIFHRDKAFHASTEYCRAYGKSYAEIFI